MLVALYIRQNDVKIVEVFQVFYHLFPKKIDSEGHVRHVFQEIGGTISFLTVMMTSYPYSL